MKPGYDQLLKAEDLLRARWRNLVMLTLHDRGEPTRFSDLRRAIFEYTDRHPNDSRLTAALAQLRTGGIVRKETNTTGHPFWALTEEGVACAEILEMFLQMLAERDDP